MLSNPSTVRCELELFAVLLSLLVVVTASVALSGPIEGATTVTVWLIGEPAASDATAGQVTVLPLADPPPETDVTETDAGKVNVAPTPCAEPPVTLTVRL